MAQNSFSLIFQPKHFGQSGSSWAQSLPHFHIISRRASFCKNPFWDKKPFSYILGQSRKALKWKPSLEVLMSWNSNIPPGLFSHLLENPDCPVNSYSYPFLDELLNYCIGNYCFWQALWRAILSTVESNTLHCGVQYFCNTFLKMLNLTF